MRSIETGFHNYLAGLAETNGATVCVNVAPQGTNVPFIIFQIVRTENYATMDDPGDDSLRAETIRVSTYHSTAAKAREMSDNIAEALDGYSGTMGDDRKAEAVWIEDETAEYVPPQFVDAYHVCDLTLTIQHSPAS